MREKIELAIREVTGFNDLTGNGKSLTCSILAAIGEGQEELAKRLHYPECWDTACYPTLHDALLEVTGNCGCSECNPLQQPEPVQQEPVEWNLDAETTKFLADTIMAGDEPAEITLRVGFIKDDEGKVQHGLLMYDSEYPEEGASMLVESPAPQPVPDASSINCVTPEMLRDAQTKSELGAHACADLSGGYSLITELFEVMFRAAGNDAIVEVAGLHKQLSILCDERDKLRRQLAAAQARGDELRNRLSAHLEDLGNSKDVADRLAGEFDTTALDTLLADKERETVEKCANIIAKSVTRDQAENAIRALMPKEKSDVLEN